MEVELQDLNFYAAFEEAVTTYGNELYAFQVRDNLLNVIGAPTASNMNHAVVTPSMQGVIRLTQQYAVEAGAGGNVNWYSGSFATTASIQDYDLEQWAIDNNITGGIEIKRVFHYGPPAVTRFYDPYAGTGLGTQNLMDSFGFGAYSPSVNFVLMPVSYDMQVIQAIEFNDTVRKSAYSFELINNKLRIFPIPDRSNVNIYFQYLKIDERLNSIIGNTPGAVTNPSNVNFTNPNYSQINSIGRQWIFEYTLALCKEMLGYVRGKYQSTIPIPGREISLNSSDLVTAATTEKTALIERLRTYLDETSRQALLARKQAESDSTMNELGKSPMQIFIG
jgi:hypothetical protein